MPSNYRYPGKSDFESVSKEMKKHGVKTGEVSDVDASKLYREKMDSRLVGSAGNAKPFVSAVAFPSGKGSVHNTMKLAQMTIKQGDMG